MGNNRLVSVILPAYNVRDYIEECILSLSRQVYDNFEIIVVDDGSTDGTCDVVERLLKKVKNLFLFRQENAGSGPARNLGISKSRGEYVVFVDPDDWVDDLYLSSLVEAREKYDVDLVCMSHIDVLQIGTGIKTAAVKHPFLLLNTKEDAEAEYGALLSEEVVTAPTRKLYLKSIIKSNDIEFPPLRRSQDISFNLRYYSRVEKLVVLPNAHYFYRIQGLDNYVAKLRKDYYLIIDFLFKEMKHICGTWGGFKENEKGIIEDYLVNLYAVYIESCIQNKIGFEDSLDNDTIAYLVNNVRPKKFFNRLVIGSLKRRWFGCLKLVTWIRRIARKARRLLKK